MAESHDVVVLGCGLMGSTLARALAAGGYSTAAWNRTHQRAEALTADGVRAITDVREAVASAPLIVTCVTDYDATLEAFEDIADLAGKTVVNLGSGAPEEVVAFEAAMTERGGESIDGSIICYPQSIGTPEGAILYSGSPETWARHEKTLMALGGSSAHVSTLVTASSVLNIALVGAFFVASLSAFVEATSYVLKEGVDPALLAAMTPITLDFLGRTAADAVTEIATGQYETDQATIDTYLAGLEPALVCIEAAGLRTRVIDAAVENLRAASAAGFGSQGFAAHAKILARRTPAFDGSRVVTSAAAEASVQNR